MPIKAGGTRALVTIDARGAIVTVNEGAARMFGWVPSDLVGRPVETLFTTALAQAHFQRQAESNPDGLSTSHEERVAALLQRRDGSRFAANVAASVNAGHGGDLLEFVIVGDDKDDVAEVQQAIDTEHARRLDTFGQLAGGVAHDFNNLLGVILNCVAVASRHTDQPSVSADLAEIRAAALRGAALTRQLLTFSRLDLPRPETVEITAALRDVAAQLDRALGDGIELVLELGDDPVEALFDRTQLEQILLNLAINARDAMAGGGTFTIAVELGGHDSHVTPRAARITVTDTGHGMPAEVLAHAFEPFFTTKSAGHGTGLGLASVWEIVYRNGGSVSIASVVDQGTSVVLLLPGAASDA